MRYKILVRKEGVPDETRVVEEDSRFKVYEAVDKEGGVVITLVELEGKSHMPKFFSMTFGSGVKTEPKITFTKNLSAMLGAGLTLSRALSVIERQAGNKYLKKIVTELESQVRQGAAFHEALAKYPNVFSKLFIAMVKAGEESGKIAESLEIVSKQMERSYTLTKKIKGAMIYPAIILSAVFVIGILMLIFVVPTLSNTFKSLGVDLPFATRVIIGSSDFVASHVLLVFGGIVALVIAAVVFFRSKTGGRLVLAVSLRLPVIGDLVRETYVARASRALASLLSSGVQMLTAISITHEVVGDNVFGKVIVEAEERVRKGESLSKAFEGKVKLYPILMAEMIAVGEETGKVSEMLSQVAEYYESDVEARTKDLSTIIEPVLMLVIGVFVGVFALAMIAPIYSLSSKI